MSDPLRAAGAVLTIAGRAVDLGTRIAGALGDPIRAARRDRIRAARARARAARLRAAAEAMTRRGPVYRSRLARARRAEAVAAAIEA